MITADDLEVARARPHPRPAAQVRRLVDARLDALLGERGPPTLRATTDATPTGPGARADDPPTRPTRSAASPAAGGPGHRRAARRAADRVARPAARPHPSYRPAQPPTRRPGETAAERSARGGSTVRRGSTQHRRRVHGARSTTWPQAPQDRRRRTRRDRTAVRRVRRVADEWHGAARCRRRRRELGDRGVTAGSRTADGTTSPQEGDRAAMPAHAAGGLGRGRGRSGASSTAWSASDGRDSSGSCTRPVEPRRLFGPRAWCVDLARRLRAGDGRRTSTSGDVLAAVARGRAGASTPTSAWRSRRRRRLHVDGGAGRAAGRAGSTTRPPLERARPAASGRRGARVRRRRPRRRSSTGTDLRREPAGVPTYRRADSRWTTAQPRAVVARLTQLDRPHDRRSVGATPVPDVVDDLGDAGPRPRRRPIGHRRS